jgi:ABC-2 type transport system permease protein
MNSVILIAKREFKAGFSTPRTSAVVFFFLLFMGWFFSNFIDTFISLQQRAPMMGGQAPTMEQLLRAMFYNLHFILILIVPAVTMGVFSEEKKSQSFRLLQTAPISSLTIVLGKFIAVAAVMAIVLMLSFVFPGFLLAYGNPDFGVVFGSYVGLFLLICAQLAFGVWVSSMTQNQFMAFLFTMLGLFLMMVIDFLAPTISGGGFFEDVLF